MRGLTIGKGVKVKLHAFDTMPILEDAFSVAPGFETFIGITMVRFRPQSMLACSNLNE